MITPDDMGLLSQHTVDRILRDEHREMLPHQIKVYNNKLTRRYLRRYIENNEIPECDCHITTNEELLVKEHHVMMGVI